MFEVQCMDFLCTSCLRDVDLTPYMVVPPGWQGPCSASCKIASFRDLRMHTRDQTNLEQSIQETCLCSLVRIQDLNHAGAVSLIRDASQRALERERLSLHSLAPDSGPHAGDGL